CVEGCQSAANPEDTRREHALTFLWRRALQQFRFGVAALNHTKDTKDTKHDRQVSSVSFVSFVFARRCDQALRRDEKRAGRASPQRRNSTTTSRRVYSSAAPANDTRTIGSPPPGCGTRVAPRTLPVCLGVRRNRSYERPLRPSISRRSAPSSARD